MPSISLATYSLRAIDNVTQLDCEDISNLPGGYDLLDILEDYCDERNNELRSFDRQETAIRIIQSNRDNRSICGVIEKGNYGFRSTLYDIDKGIESHSRIPEEADLRPYYFLGVVPEGRKQALIALQRFGQIGFKTDFYSDLQDFLNDYQFLFRVNMNMIVPRSLLDYYLNNGRIVKLRYIKYQAPCDLSDKIGVDFPEEKASLEFIVKAGHNKRLKLRGGFDDFLAKRGDIGEHIEVMGIDYNNVKAEIDINGRRRTIDFNKPYELWAILDITDRVKIGKGGHPDFQSIDNVAREILGEIERDIKDAGNVEV